MNEPARELPRSIGVWGGAAIMVGIIIGSGIFRTPASIARELGSPGIILLFWVIGGLISLCGAFTYAEIGTMFPRAGGLYAYLYEGFGPRLAFVFGWTYLFIAHPLALAAMATVFSEHLNHLTGDHAGVRGEQIITCGLLVLLTWLNVTGMKRGAATAVVLTSIKVFALVGMVVLALVLMKGDAANFAAVAAPKTLFAAIAPVMGFILWTYDGWSDVAAVAEEVREPQKRLPRIFLLGTAATVLIYVAVNATYLWLIPLPEMAATKTVAPLVMERLIGPKGSTVVTVMIMISTLGAVHASIICGARVSFAQGRDGLFYEIVARVHPRYGTPHVSLWLKAAIACAVTIGLQTFEKLTGGFIFTIWIFYGLAGVTIFLHRARLPDAPRPFRCWGYPVVPALFVLSAAVMTVLAIVDDWKGTLPWLAVLAAGFPAYTIWRRFRRPAPSAADQ